ncbi:MAG TPA: ATP-binding protein [Phenylobacterium sp.]|nr:ATP-binding protein [Phenylobacterium sp.]
MLIEFSVTNFRSFRERQTLSMVASRLAEHADTHTFESGLAGFERLLATSVIYGPNASGKTNLLLALQIMQQTVLTSAAANLVLRDWRAPFKLDRDSRAACTVFEITFALDGVHYDYGFALSDERVEREWLIEYVNPRGRTLFERKWVDKKGDYDWQFSSFLKGQRVVWSDATRPNALYLTTAVQLNAKQLAPLFAWFQQKLIVVAGPNAGLNPSLTASLLDTEGGKAKVLPFLREADFEIDDVVVRREPINGPIIGPVMAIEHNQSGTWALRGSFVHPSIDGSGPVALDFAEESRGTQMMFQAAGAWLQVLEQGAVILFDELETSLHPLIIRYLVQQFQGASSNPRKAQLIFSTHNTSLLDMDVFRRDQIWFVERGPKAGSRVYPLTEFKPRQGEALERGYLRGRYGALPLVEGAPA